MFYRAFSNPTHCYAMRGGERGPEDGIFFEHVSYLVKKPTVVYEIEMAS
jgi:hypothetical protein